MEAKAATTKRKARKKSAPESSDTEVLEEEVPAKVGSTKARSKNGAAPKQPGRKKKNSGGVKSLTEEFLEEDIEVSEEEDLDPDLADLDPLDDPVVLDPELEDDSLKTRTSPPKPKTGKLAPRMQLCRECGKEVTWTSTERLCFQCLKKNIAAKRNDDIFGIADDADGGM